MPRERSTNGSSLTARKWAYAKKALQYADEAIEGLATLMRSAENESVRLGAIKEILDRSLGKAPPQIDITALQHTEIVYQSAQEIRAALAARGVPPALLDYTPPPSDKDDETK